MEVSNGWIEYRKLILSELERMNRNMESLRDDVEGLRREVSMLKVKSGVWGAIAGAVPATLVLFYLLLRGVIR